MTIAKAERTQIIDDYKTHESDTGSPEVQVAVLTSEIKALTEHLKRHKTDFTSRRGLLIKVGRRTTLLRYLSRKDSQRYKTLIQRLGLRR